jgi:hypothetical protein
MSLRLGKSFNRSYKLRLPIMNGFYNIGLFFDKRSTFLLFKVDPDFSEAELKHNLVVNMYKNLESSRFCETFIKLHNFRKNTLDICNQFDKIKDEFTHEVSFILNETITLAKVDLGDGKEVFDTLNIYGFTINSYVDEFIFLLTERHNIQKRLGKKIVRTSGIQIASSRSIEFLNEMHGEFLTSGKAGTEKKYPTDKVIKFSDVDGG